MLPYSDNGEPWFRGKYVATILKYSGTDKAIRNYVFEEENQKTTNI